MVMSAQEAGGYGNMNSSNAENRLLNINNQLLRESLAEQVHFIYIV